MEKNPGKVALNVNTTDQLVVFTLDEQRYALPLSAVTRIIHAIEVTPLPTAPDIFLGIINVSGQVIPVVNVRKRFKLPKREIELTDAFIIAKTSKRPIALVADAVNGVISPPNQKTVQPEKILPKMKYIEGVLKLKDGLVFIHDLEKFLSLNEEKKLETVLSKKK